MGLGRYWPMAALGALLWLMALGAVAVTIYVVTQGVN